MTARAVVTSIACDCEFAFAFAFAEDRPQAAAKNITENTPQNNNAGTIRRFVKNISKKLSPFGL